MQVDINYYREDYNIENLFNSIINFLEKVIVNDCFSIMYSKGRFVSLSYFGCERFCIELDNSRWNLTVHDFADCTRDYFLNVYSISTYFTETLGRDSGKKFLIYLKSGLI